MVSHPKSKALYLLPSTLTMGSFCCGLMSIHLSTSGRGTAAVAVAAALIFASIAFDMFDGLVARLMHTQSRFGAELDSISDVVAFGVAPAFLAHRAGLSPLPLGLAVAAAYAICGAMRLARFNVLSSSGTRDTRFYAGLSVPMAASLLAALAIARHRLGTAWALPATAWAAVVLVLGLLMVSPVRYRAFKRVRLSRRGLAWLGVLAAPLALVAIFAAPEVTGIVILVGYIASGPCEAGLRRLGLRTGT